MERSVKDTELSTNGVGIVLESRLRVLPELADAEELVVADLLSDVLDKLPDEVSEKSSKAKVSVSGH